MAKYIEREKIGLTDFEIAMCNGDYKEAFKMLNEKIDSIPATDVRPVMRGIWEKQDANLVWNDVGLYSTLYKCNRCGELNIAETNFCPNCGAHMREES